VIGYMMRLVSSVRRGLMATCLKLATRFIMQATSRVPVPTKEFHLVDSERIVGHKPTLTAEAATLPLTTITATRRFLIAWELCVMAPTKGEQSLIIGGRRCRVYRHSTCQTGWIGRHL
jgi:hypothetical protein